MIIWPKTGLSLQCYPIVPSHVSQPWDAADDYLIESLPTGNDITTLLINDRHGVLACHYPKAHSLISQFCAKQALLRNSSTNKIDISDTQLLTENQPLPNHITDVVIKIPKSVDLLQHWLELCRQQLPSETRYWLAGMSKHIPTSWLKWLQQHSHSYQQYPIARKARLMVITLGLQPLHKNQWFGYKTADEIRLLALPGVFSRNSMDIGSQFLLQHLPALSGQVVDLGCGNGLLALTCKKRYPACEVYATDDAWQAIESCRYNAKQSQLDINVLQGNGLSNIAIQPDWVLCNPPFHDGAKQLTDIAIMMFEQSAKKLKDDGRLLVIANRHLPYFKALSKRFQTVKTIASNSKFHVYLANTPKRQRLTD